MRELCEAGEKGEGGSVSSYEIRQGHVLDRLREMPDESVHCVVTSPPYWSLRDYGTGQWAGGDVECDHQIPASTLGGSGGKQASHPGSFTANYGQACGKCGATRIDKQLGLEATPDEFVANMVAVFREVKRVLRSDGSCWLNIGDSYGASGGFGHSGVNAQVGNTKKEVQGRADTRGHPTIKPKDLCMIPARLALALQQPFYTGVIKHEKDRTWLAALVDGEGCIGIRRQNQSGRVGPGYNDTYIPYLTVKMSDREPLDRAVELTGLGSVRAQAWRVGPDKRKVNTVRVPYVWRLDGNKAVQVARELYPHLLVKSKQAACLHTLDVSNKEKKRGRGNTVPDDVMAFRQGIYEYLKALNQRTDDQTPTWLVTPPPMYEPGFYLRSEITWCKRAPMPESVRDRPTSATEKIYLLTKAERYFYDADAVRVPSAYPVGSREDVPQGVFGGKYEGGAFRAIRNERNMWNYWLLSPDPYAEAHFATFPREIPRRAILAGTSEHGVCGACGAPWRRCVERVAAEITNPRPFSKPGNHDRNDTGRIYEETVSQTTGWQPTCPCGQDAPTVPATVLDCFSGAGTTGLVAVQLGRRYVGIELNSEYIAMSEKRIHNEGAPLFSWADSNGKQAPSSQAVGSQ